MLASTFTDGLALQTLLGALIFVSTAVVMLPLPVHPWLRGLAKADALNIDAVGHLAGFAVMSLGASDVDGVMIFLFGLVPASLLSLGSFAMKRRVRE